MLIGTNSTIIGQGTSKIGRQSTLFGSAAGTDLTALQTNAAVFGYQAAEHITGATTASLVAIGYAAGRYTGAGNGMVAIGGNSGQYAKWYSVFVGADAGRYNAGNYQTFVGRGAGQATSGTHSTGSGNSGLGYYALRRLSTGPYNTSLGYESGTSTTTGIGNTYLGYQAGALNMTGDYNIMIGYGADTSSETVDNELNIGDIILGSIASGSEYVSIPHELRLPTYADATRGAAATAGRVIFNTDDGQLNIDDGANWTLPDGTTT